MNYLSDEYIAPEESTTRVDPVVFSEEYTDFEDDMEIDSDE